MFGRAEHKRRGISLPFVIFRLCLSLIMFVILGFGAYRALVYFSGLDPLRQSASSEINNFLTSESAESLVDAIFGLKIPPQVAKFLPAIRPANAPLPTFPPGTFVLPPATVSGTLQYRFVVVGDSHNDNEYLTKALSQAKNVGAKFVIGTGDYTDTGTVDELQRAKNAFDVSGLPYYVTVGDHDLWSARDKGLNPVFNFNKVFGTPYQSFADGNVRFILLANSDIYQGVDEAQMRWLQAELQRVKGAETKQIFAFMEQPLYHPASDHVMGKENPDLKAQASQILKILKQFGVGEIFSGDTHAFARFIEPTTGLKITAIGAVTRNRNVQLPSFVMVDVFTDGNYNVQNVEIK